MSTGRWCKRKDGAQELSGTSGGDSRALSREDGCITPTEALGVLTFIHKVVKQQRLSSSSSAEGE